MPKMKDTGIVWCPSIPSDWKVRRVKDCFTISKIKAGIKNPVVLKLARSGIKVKDVTVNEGQMAESYNEYNPVMIGDLLLNPMDLYSGANCNVSEVEGVISPAYVNLRAKQNINPYFFDYYFKVQYWVMAMFAHGKGVSYDNRWTINAEGIKNYEIPLPELSTQNRIVKIIREKCSQIDALIANAQQQIEKLKAYKQSVITETVTKGLNPDVPMKDSGVEWIGDIPEHWICTKIKYVTDVSRGLFNHRPRNDPRFYNGNYPFIQTGDVAQTTKYITEYGQTLNENGIKVSKKFPKGTLTMTIAANIGDVAILNFDAYFPDSVVGYVPNSNCHGNYLYYVFRAMKMVFVNASTMNTQLNLNVERVKNLNMPFALSIIEQQQIADFLDTKCSQIDHIITLKQQKIEKLQQYKKSIIYEYVTGKKEV